MYLKDKTKIISVRVSEETYDTLMQIKELYKITPSTLCRQVFEGIQKGFNMADAIGGANEQINKKENK